MEEVADLLSEIRFREEAINSRKRDTKYMKKLSTIALYNRYDENEYREKNIQKNLSEIERHSSLIDDVVTKLASLFHRDVEIYEKTRYSRTGSESRVRGINHRRKVFCVYRLYKQDVPLEIISRILGMNLNLIRSYIGEAFAEQCLKNSCWAKPFILDTVEVNI